MPPQEELSPWRQYPKYVRDGTVRDMGIPKRIHVVGPATNDAPSIVALLLQAGHTVTGTRVAGESVEDLEYLLSLGLEATEEFRPPAGTDFVLVGESIFPDDHRTIVQAEARGIPVVGRGPVLAGLAKVHARSVGVIGTFGKSTTTTMTTAVLEIAPNTAVSHLIDARVPGRDRGAKWNSARDTLVAEAHEPDRSAELTAWSTVIVTNVHQDHAERFGGLSGLHALFVNALRNTSGLRLVCADDSTLMRLAENSGMSYVTYGQSPNADWRVVDVSVTFDGTSPWTQFSLVEKSSKRRVIEDVKVPLFGSHSAIDAAAALLVGNQWGVPFKDSAAVLSGVSLPKNRVQVIGTLKGATVIGDNANLPESIAASLAGAKHVGRPIVAAFEVGDRRVNSQWITRMPDYARALSQADRLVITDREGGNNPSDDCARLLSALAEFLPSEAISYVPKSDFFAGLKKAVGPDDLCFVLGKSLEFFFDERRNLFDQATTPDVAARESYER
jgi:UDP-N-acetylmuramate--alanine ligase